SRPVAAGDAVLVGADWGGDPDVEVHLRVRRGERWEEWVDLHLPHDEHAPDPGTAEAARDVRTATDPVWIGKADALQLRVADAAPDAVTLHAVEMRGGDGIDWLPPELRGRPGAAVAAPTEPTIVPRRSWDPRDQCTPKSPPGYAGDVRLAYVHHTASTNSYSASQGPAQILSFCLYHRDVRGWDDIGYNALVDRYGTIYEGRAGGLTEPVIGAHASGFNAGSFGVATVGNFAEIPPPDALKAALVRLLAWKLDLHHVDPQGETKEISGGGATNKIPEDRVVTLPTILGHRDTGTTDCPGGYLYQYVSGQLPADVAASGAPKLYGGPRAREEQPVIGERPRWDVTLSQSAGWELAIRDADGRLIRGSRGTGSSIELAWDLRDFTGREVAPGTYTARLSTAGATPIETTFAVTPAVERRYASERIGTAVALSRWAFDHPQRVEAGFPITRDVVIASAEVYADALVASPLAGSVGAPVLLTGRDTLDPSVVQEVKRLGATTAWLVGGEARLSKQIETDLDQRTDVGTVRRLAGPTRYHTAGQVAWEIVKREKPSEVLLALGGHSEPSRAFPDALAAGAFGAAEDLPVLLVQQDSLPEPTRWALSHRPVGDRADPGAWAKTVTVFGGSKAVTDQVAAEAVRVAGGATLERFAGVTRYHTAQLAADDLLRRWAEAPTDPNSYS
ncbi:MAG: cell wall-binding repeat-containing protein, partial [Actinomycetota bacterium]|nr:cell wall-binding repeat-containing protein [Actinomycetota bacterium]